MHLGRCLIDERELLTLRKIEIFIKVPMPKGQELGYKWENTRNFIGLFYYYFLSTYPVSGT